MSKTVIVAGSFGALGKAVATELLERKMTVVAVDVASVPNDWNMPAFGQIDLADEQSVEMTYAAVADKHGHIDGLVNVAGGFTWEPIVGGTTDSWDRMYRMNLRTAVVSSRAALPHLKPGSAIVNIGAAVSSGPGVGMAPYAASKAGVRALTESMAEEVRARGIRVNAVLPTILDTDMNRRDMPDGDSSTWVSPADAAKVIAFLLSDEAASITGASISLSLGRSSTI